MNFFRNALNFVIAPIRPILSSPGTLITSPLKLLGLSLPARIAGLIALFLMSCTLIIVLRASADPEITDFNTQQILVIVALSLVITLFAYWLTKEWILNTRKSFSDIRRDWNSGLRTLERCEMSLTDAPVFLLLGSDGVDTSRCLSQATELNLNFKDIPESPDSALQWFACEDAIYLAPVRAGCLSETARMCKDVDSSSNVPGGETDTASQRWQSAGIEKSPIDMSADVQQRETERLEFLCDLLRSFRQPVTPINGIVLLVPYSAVSCPRDSEENTNRAIIVQSDLAKAIRKDLAVVRESLGIRCPTAVLILDTDNDRPFEALVARITNEDEDPEKQSSSIGTRIGSRASLWAQPSSEHVSRVGHVACRWLENRVLDLVFDANNIEIANNRELYALVCEQRRSVAPNLDQVLKAFVSNHGDDAHESALFSGCYFGAVHRKSRSAFLRDLLVEKLWEEHDQLRWCLRIDQQEQRYRSAAIALWIVNAVLAAGAASLAFL